jgi:hypothetical protein
MACFGELFWPSKALRWLRRFMPNHHSADLELSLCHSTVHRLVFADGQTCSLIQQAANIWLIEPASPLKSANSPDAAIAPISLDESPPPSIGLPTPTDSEEIIMLPSLRSLMVGHVYAGLAS